ncbi:MAG: phosphatase PAP2 family protein [Alphaproteobacteria bacterium]|nr:phosphatase PAP2 family protein [Alphaproteobacteria bacterium]
MTNPGYRHRNGLWRLVVYAAVSLAFSNVEGLAETAAPDKTPPGFVAGYLPKEALPDSLSLLPPPPATGSAAQARDEEAAKHALALNGTPRWKLATLDADLSFPNAAGTFSCALMAPVTEADTPHLYVLLQRSMTDAGLATYAAKDGYKRLRPFMINNQPICSPEYRKRLEDNGAYPSGHASLGWAWALILSEIAPERTNAILARGRAFGDSRSICNVHWESDVAGGRLVGAGVVARLHADPAFLADLAAAKAELAAVRGKKLGPIRDCRAEAEAMAISP